MAKHKKVGKAKGASSALVVERHAVNGHSGVADPEPDSLGRKDFEKHLEHLQIELVKLQEWVRTHGAKVCVLFEGRDAAGKGGIIKRMTERTSPRIFRTVALPAPTEREKSQMYMQRSVPHLPAAGESVLFDRSCYTRAGVARVTGCARPAEGKRL